MVAADLFPFEDFLLIGVVLQTYVHSLFFLLRASGRGCSLVKSTTVGSKHQPKKMSKSMKNHVLAMPIECNGRIL